jgi:hypothetical protein
MSSRKSSGRNIFAELASRNDVSQASRSSLDTVSRRRKNATVTPRGTPQSSSSSDWKEPVPRHRKHAAVPPGGTPYSSSSDDWYNTASITAVLSDSAPKDSINHPEIVTGIRKSWMHGLKIENMDFGVTVHGPFTLIREIYGAVAWPWAHMYVNKTGEKYTRSFSVTPLPDGSYKMPTTNWYHLRQVLQQSSVPDVS